MELRLREGLASALVWTTWGGTLLFALVTIYQSGRNIPVVEDWLMVSAVTGHEPSLLSSLWSQNGEHRIPFPRFVLLLLLRAFHGDFRVGMYVSVVSTGIVAAFMILGLRRFRNGTTRITDAFFPLTLLHLGNWENFAWSWQLTQTLPILILLLLILRVATHPTFRDPASSLLGGMALISLPLSGAPGLLGAAFFIPYLGFYALSNRREALRHGTPLWPSGFLLASILVAVVTALLYFVGYEAPYNDPSPGLAYTMGVFSRFLVMSTGLALVPFRQIAFVALSAMLAATVAISVSHIRRGAAEHRPNALGLLLLLGMWLVICYSVAHTRAGMIFAFPRVGPMSRYVLLFSPVILIPYLLWDISPSRSGRRFFQSAMCMAMLVLYPQNYRIGSEWGYWYRTVYDGVAADIASGMPALQLAERHRDDLVHWWTPERLASHMEMLRDANMTVFSSMRADTSFRDATPPSPAQR